MDIPDQLWERMVEFVRRVDEGQWDYLEGSDIYDDTEAILEAVAKLEEERGG